MSWADSYFVSPLMFVAAKVCARHKVLLTAVWDQTLCVTEPHIPSQTFSEGPAALLSRRPQQHTVSASLSPFCVRICYSSRARPQQTVMGCSAYPTNMGKNMEVEVEGATRFKPRPSLLLELV